MPGKDRNPQRGQPTPDVDQPAEKQERKGREGRTGKNTGEKEIDESGFEREGDSQRGSEQSQTGRGTESGSRRTGGSQ